MKITSFIIKDVSSTVSKVKYMDAYLGGKGGVSFSKEKERKQYTYNFTDTKGNEYYLNTSSPKNFGSLTKVYCSVSEGHHETGVKRIDWYGKYETYFLTKKQFEEVRERRIKWEQEVIEKAQEEINRLNSLDHD